MKQLDQSIPEPKEILIMLSSPIEDIFSIEGRGTVVTGIERGIVKVGDEVEIAGLMETKKTTITGVEMLINN